VTANNDAAPLRTDDLTLPQYGWLAHGAGVRAWTALCQGVIADYAQTSDSTFANARSVQDWKMDGAHRIGPSVSEFRQTGDRAFTLEYAWQVGEALPRDYQCFVHFVADEKIVFQGDHALPRPSSTWKAGETVSDGPHQIRLPEDLRDGDYDVRTGLYLPEAGRLTLLGRNDGESRVRLGTLHVRDNGRNISFEKEPPSADDEEDIYFHRLNAAGKVLDFGDLRTDGSVLVRREGEEWVLRAMSRKRDFFVELNASRFGRPASVSCVDGSTPTMATQTDGNWWHLKLNGAREYHWK